MKARTFHFLITCLVIGGPLLSAQTISLHFPQFSGRDWDLVLQRGLGKDTILSGQIPEDGRVVLNIPASHRDYAGMARWMLRNGGGLDFVLNGESFSVECLSDQPDETNIIYTGTVENTFLRDNYREQERMQRQYEAVRMGLRAFPEDAPLYPQFAAERERLEAGYEKFMDDLAASPLYAARFREIVNFTRGIGSTFEDDEYARALAADDFLRNRMSWPALYTSNHWSGVCFSWVQLHVMVLQNDSLLLASARDILTKFDDRQRYTDLCEQISRYFTKNGKDSLLQALAPEVSASGKLLHYSGLLSPFKSLPTGAPAPPLVRPDGERMDWSGTPARMHLLIFYQSDCGHCETTLTQLTANYPTLRDAGVNVISVSGDVDRATYEGLSGKFPWREKYYDGKGFDSPNFQAFGVVGTPTLVAIDSKGTVRQRGAQLPEMMMWMEQQAGLNASPSGSK